MGIDSELWHQCNYSSNSHSTMHFVNSLIWAVWPREACLSLETQECHHKPAMVGFMQNACSTCCGTREGDLNDHSHPMPFCYREHWRMTRNTGGLISNRDHLQCTGKLIVRCLRILENYLYKATCVYKGAPPNEDGVVPTHISLKLCRNLHCFFFSYETGCHAGLELAL